MSTALYDVIARRRDVRAEFTGAPVDEDALHRVVEAAHRAPSVGMSQPWDFVVVRDPATRQAFRDHVATERDTFAASLPPDRRSTFDKIKVEGICESSMGVVVTHDWLRLGTVSHLEAVPDLERHGWRSRRPLADAIHHDTWES